MPASEFHLPAVFDLGATFAFALTGALAGIKRHYDIVGVFFLALASGIGGGTDPGWHIHPRLRPDSTPR